MTDGQMSAEDWRRAALQMEHERDAYKAGMERWKARAETAREALRDLCASTRRVEARLDALSEAWAKRRAA